MVQWVSSPPLLTDLTYLQLDLLARTFFYFHWRAIRFLGLQKVGVAIDALSQILPGI
jgi:hypothetical protein